MGVREIPVTYEFDCDVCGLTAQSNNNSRPKHWAELNIIQDAYDYSDHAVADGSVKRMLCPQCTVELTGVINDKAKELAARTPAQEGE